MGERKRAIRFVYGGKLFPIRRNQNAQALIEFVLILPILLILVVGALEFGRLWSTKTVLTQCGTRGGVLHDHAYQNDHNEWCIYYIL